MTARTARDSQTHCDNCGWTSKVTTAGLADHALRLHSCDRTRRLAESAARGRAIHEAVDRTPKPCQHKRAQHQHGHYATYTLDGCRCLPCAAAASDYERARVRRIAYGKHTLVDAEPARAHIRSLMAQGMGFKRVSDKAGVSYSVVTTLLYGKPGMRPSRRIKPAAAEAILAVRLDLAEHALTDATGTWRRLEALQAIGWSKAALARQLGNTAPSIQYDRNLVHVETAQRVRDLYERLWDTDGGNARARNQAARNGWPPPLWWDLEDLDDPTFVVQYEPWRPAGKTDVDELLVEHVVAGHRAGRLTVAERREVVRRLHANGLNDQQIADRTGMADRTVLRIRRDLGLASVESRRAA